MALNAGDKKPKKLLNIVCVRPQRACGKFPGQGMRSVDPKTRHIQKFNRKVNQTQQVGNDVQKNIYFLMQVT